MVRSGSASAVERTRIVGMDAEARGKSGEACPLVVPGALPGEAVEVVVEHSGKTARFARLLKVLEASPERTTPQCRHFLNCGGCDLLHASLPLQHHHKRQQVALELGLPLFDVAEVVPSPQAFEYRTVAKMVVGPGVLGSYRPRSHDVVDMSGCRIHSATVELVLSTARAHLLAEGPGDLRYLVVREDDRRRALVLIITRALGSSAADALASVLAQLPQVAEIRVQENQSPGDGIFSDGPERRVYGEAGAAVGAFSQVNPGAAAELYRVATELLAPAGREVLELYAGSGGLEPSSAGGRGGSGRGGGGGGAGGRGGPGLGPNFALRRSLSDHLGPSRRGPAPRDELRGGQPTTQRVGAGGRTPGGFADRTVGVRLLQPRDPRPRSASYLAVASRPGAGLGGAGRSFSSNPPHRDRGASGPSLRRGLSFLNRMKLIGSRSVSSAQLVLPSRGPLTTSR
jgi:hypothetical protein